MTHNTVPTSIFRPNIQHPQCVNILQKEPIDLTVTCLLANRFKHDGDAGVVCHGCVLILAACLQVGCFFLIFDVWQIVSIPFYNQRLLSPHLQVFQVFLFK